MKQVYIVIGFRERSGGFDETVEGVFDNLLAAETLAELKRVKQTGLSSMENYDSVSVETHELKS